ncbi:cytochrome C [Burkholderia pyrrocinia]|uniref:c-type cytochrome n=1 Tax=Burkholderia pyrrocinia TaxID=60550 RepID=UPI00157730DC|nr:c-type cytochrome [Burkholderia pyrrocinia]NTX30179.1 cytochrome C [Burkholderia pyrrocinia]
MFRIQLRAISVIASCAAIVATPAVAAPPADGTLARQLAERHACLGCHAIDRKLVGPAYRDVAARYANDPGAADRLASHIRNGSTGAWGAVPMPPNRIDAGDARLLADWILAGAHTP